MKSWQFSEEPASTSQFLVSTRGPLAAFLQIRPGAFFESTQSPRKVPVLEFGITHGGMGSGKPSIPAGKRRQSRGAMAERHEEQWGKNKRRVPAGGRLVTARMGWTLEFEAAELVAWIRNSWATGGGVSGTPSLPK
jgi:hypothetical protein